MLAIGLDRRVNRLLDLCILVFVDFDFLLDAESGSDSDDIPKGPEAKYNTARKPNLFVEPSMNSAKRTKPRAMANNKVIMLLLSFTAGLMCEAVRIPIFQFLQIELSDGVHTNPEFITEFGEIPENVACFQ